MAKSPPSSPPVIGHSIIPELCASDAAKVNAALQTLVPKQAAFVNAIVAGQTNAQAAKLAGYKGRANLAAKRLLADPAVAKAIEDVRAVMANRVLFDFDMAHNLLVASYDFARTSGNANAAVKAAETLAKLHGHLTDKLDVSAQGNLAFVLPYSRKPADEPKVIEGGHE